MENILKRTRNHIIIMAIITLLLGLFMIICPNIATMTLCIIIGWVLVVFGLITVISYLIRRKKEQASIWYLILGILELAVGIWVLIAPAFWVRFLFIAFGVLMILHAIGDFGDCIELKRCGFARWWLSLIFGLFTLGLAALVIFKPFEVAATMVVVCGIALVIDAVTDLIIIIKAGSAFRKVKKEAEPQLKEPQI